MTTTYARRLPRDHLVAEVLAVPFASEAGLQRAVVSLEPDDRGRVGPTHLWRRAEVELLRAFPSMSVDALVALRDVLWFQGRRSGPLPLHEYLRRVARLYLESDGVTTRPRLDGLVSGPAAPSHDAVEPVTVAARRAWRWLGFALPPDLVLAGLPGRSTCDVLAPALASRLASSGIAENHLHLGAGAGFPALWVGALHAVAARGVKPTAFSSPAASLTEGRRMGPWLLRAAIARWILAELLFTTAGSDSRGFLDRRLTRHLGSGDATLLKAWALAPMLEGRVDVDACVHTRLQDLLRRLTRGSGPPGRDAGAEAWLNSDPITHLVGGARNEETAEVRWTRRGLAYMEGEGHKDRLFAALFWQIQRVRVLFYRHLVQRPLVPGLQWFTRHYSRIRPARRHLPGRAALELTARGAGLGRGLRVLEVRTSPERTVTGVLGKLRRIQANADAVLRGLGCDFGVVLHLARKRGKVWDEGVPGAAGAGSEAAPVDPRGLPRHRYADVYRELRAEAVALGRLLHRFPGWLGLVRGVDLCNDELAVPAWVTAPLIRSVRRAASAAAGRLPIPVPPFGCTLHVGEDFVHLLGGLRRVAECLDHYELRDGDRLGHAVALGTDASSWARRAGRVAMAREERLLDLLWVRRELRAGRVGAIAADMARIEAEIETLAADWFRSPLSAREVQQLVDSLYHEPVLRAIGYGRRLSPPTPSLQGLGLLDRFLTDRGVFERGQAVVWVDASPEVRRLEELQSALLRRVERIGLTVEINPTSNLLVGDLADVDAHPFWRLSGPAGTGRTRPATVAVTLCSDDPVTFATGLPEEYQLVLDALRGAQVAAPDAHAWLESVRTHGLHASFVLPRSQQELPEPVRQTSWRAPP